ncbi:MAG: hypothetical protein IJF48_00790 [Clostridia bacterium]|nr:hypothetical protein [Clostridia bacterium]
MLIIRPIQDKALQEELCGLCNVTYNPDLLAYGAWVRDELEGDSVGDFVGICQFRMGQTATITDLAKAVGTDDTEAMFIMGRQTMNFIDLHGVHYAYFEGDCDEKFIKWLGFAKDENGKWGADLEAFFTHPCSAEK